MKLHDPELEQINGNDRDRDTEPDRRTAKCQPLKIKTVEEKGKYDRKEQSDDTQQSNPQDPPWRDEP